MNQSWMPTKPQDTANVSERVLPGIKLNLSSVQTNFVQVVRSVELLLGITVAGEAHGDLSDVSTSHNINLNTTLSRVSQLSSLNAEVQSALQVALPVLQEMAADYGMGSIFTFSAPSRDPLVTK